MFTTGEEAAEFLMHRQGHHCGYPLFHEVMAELGDPQDAFPSIHIAGTNGKGSVTNYIADILMSKGLKVGMYTSPYLVSHFDRIRINGKWIPEDVFCRYANVVEPLIDKYNLSMFEADTIIMAMYFRDEKVDMAVIEAGVGGLKDATNVLHSPRLAVITTVGMDHMATLGNTIPEIAEQKAGIIKKNGKVLTGYLVPEAMKVVEDTACKQQAEVYHSPVFEDGGKSCFILDGTKYTLSTAALYQKRNASTALKAVELLGYDIHSAEVVEAVKSSRWAGRFETVHRDPTVIVDGAHNPEGVEALLAVYPSLPKPVITVFSALKDKQGKAMCEMFREASDRLLVTQFESYRADTVSGLAAHEEEIVYDWKDALNEAMKETKNGGTVIVAGSLYFVSIVRAYFLDEK